MHPLHFQELMTEETDVLKDRRNKCFKFDAFNLNYNPFFKEITTNIYNISTYVINNFKKFVSCKRQWFAIYIIYLYVYFISKLNIWKWLVNYYYCTNFDFIYNIRENIPILAISYNIYSN